MCHTLFSRFREPNQHTDDHNTLRCWDLVLGNDQSGWGPSESISSNTRDQASRSASWDVLGTTANGTCTLLTLTHQQAHHFKIRVRASWQVRKVHIKFIQDAIILYAQGSDGTGDVIFMGVWDSWAHCGAATPCSPHLCCPLLLFSPPVSWPANHGTLIRWQVTSLHPDLDVVTTKSSNISVQWWESMNSIFTWGGDSAYSCAKFTQNSTFMTSSFLFSA